MERDVALDLFSEFEKCRETEYGGDPPTYSVRLDAAIDREKDQRYFRLRLDPSVYAEPADALLFVLEQAREHGLTVSLENSAIELT